MKTNFYILYFLMLFHIISYSQITIEGRVLDKNTNEELIGSNIIIKETNTGVSSDNNGFFSIKKPSNIFPINLTVSYIGYEKKEILISQQDWLKIKKTGLIIYLNQDNKLIKEINVVDSRLTLKQKESPLTIEALDIISIKETKVGFIVCKNFHETHNELLDIFYSYIQQYNNINALIDIKFILITESVSFLPNDILNSFKIINVSRPNDYTKIIQNKDNHFKKNMQFITNDCIMNIKEMNSFSQCKLEDLPNDIFNIICDSIIDEITGNKDLFKLREKIYDIMVYNLNAIECVYYILSFFIKNGYLNDEDTNIITKKMYNILLQYNNNYRPIYHLETIFVYIITKLK